MDEKDIENVLAGYLRAGRLAEVPVRTTMEGIATLADLVKNIPFDVYQDTSDWNLQSAALQDLIGGMTPDLVLRSRASHENRIYIEVKNVADINYEREASQVVRYFLHLLASSRKHTDQPDILRALLLAAPNAWFTRSAGPGSKWAYFLDKYQDLADAFGIVIGEVRMDGLNVG